MDQSTEVRIVVCVRAVIVNSALSFLPLTIWLQPLPCYFLPCVRFQYKEVNSTNVTKLRTCDVFIYWVNRHAELIINYNTVNLTVITLR
jgi:hypothetical protein